MQLNGGWSEDMVSYDLSTESSIYRAEPEVWENYCSVYYNMHYNGFFREEGYNAPHRHSFWIYKADCRIGGVTMAPNRI